MTSKQIAEYVGKPEKTVRTWATKASAKMATMTAKMATSHSSRPADWDLEETLCIIEAGMGANAAAMYKANAGRPISKPISLEGSTLTERDMSLIAGIVTAVMANLDNRVKAIESRVEERQALLPPSEISPEANVTKLCRSYAERNGITFQYVFDELYREFYYRYHRDINAMRKKRKITGIKVAVKEGFIKDLESLAVHLYAGKP